MRDDTGMAFHGRQAAQQPGVENLRAPDQTAQKTKTTDDEPPERPVPLQPTGHPIREARGVWQDGGVGK